MSSIETSAPSTSSVPSKAPKSTEPKKHQYVVYNRDTYAEAKYVHAIVIASSEEKAFNYLLENWKEYLERPDLEDLFGDLIVEKPDEWTPQSKSLIEDAFSDKVLSDQDRTIFQKLIRIHISSWYDVERSPKPIKIVTV